MTEASPSAAPEGRAGFPIGTLQHLEIQLAEMRSRVMQTASRRANDRQKDGDVFTVGMEDIEAAWNELYGAPPQHIAHEGSDQVI